MMVVKSNKAIEIGNIVSKDRLEGKWNIKNGFKIKTKHMKKWKQQEYISDL